MYDNNPILTSGDQSMQATAESLVSSRELSDSAMNVLVTIDTYINVGIGFGISLIVVSFLIFIFCWIVSEPDSEASKRAVSGVGRAAIGLFLAVNIWSLIRIVEWFMTISDALAYGILIISFVLLACWSFLNVGENFVLLLSQATNWILDISTDTFRKISGKDSYAGKANRSSVRAVMLIVLVLFTIVLTISQSI